MSIVTAQAARSPFVDAWERAEKIEGWLSRREAQLLHRAALGTPTDGTIVEVGAFRGRSTALLASTGRRVVTIDPLVVGSQVDENRVIGSADAFALDDVVSSFENCRWIRRASTEVVDAEIPPRIDMLYIDGEHEGDAAYRDFMRFRANLAPGASVAFHDFDSVPGVTQSVRRLESEGLISHASYCGGLFVGKYAAAQEPAEATSIRAFLAIPNNHDILPESWEAARDCVKGHNGVRACVVRKEFSILTANFNRCVVNCLNSGSFDYFALLHSDINAASGWLAVMIEEMEKVGAEVMHAPVPIKNAEGLTSTAIAYSDDPWALVRRITTHELQQLPETFDIKDIRGALKTDGQRLLCNTGVLVIKVTEAFKNFTGFRSLDRITRVSETEWLDEFVPEDWNFGHWCAEHGINVWGTRKVITNHYGRQRFSSEMIWGQEIDQYWLSSQVN